MLMPDIKETREEMKFIFPKIDSYKITVKRVGNRIEFWKKQELLYRYIEEERDGFYLDDLMYYIDDDGVVLPKVYFLVEG